jgi:hypothetical protein
MRRRRRRRADRLVVDFKDFAGVLELGLAGLRLLELKQD